MKNVLLVLTFCFCSIFLYAKEWKNIKSYRELTKNEELAASDWLKSDRKNNNIIWKNANSFNLNNNLPKEYLTIKQRRDFYKWIYFELKQKGHEVVWPTMAYFISKKLSLFKTFPSRLLIKRQVKLNSFQGSEIVFNNSFPEMKVILNSKEILKKDLAIIWDENILKKEQFDWLEEIYSKIDKRSLRQIERIAKGKFLYSIIIPKAIRFKGSISNPEARYNYALNQLKEYCQQHYH